jgi:hypothetical protein
VEPIECRFVRNPFPNRFRHRIEIRTSLVAPALIPGRKRPSGKRLVASGRIVGHSENAARLEHYSCEVGDTSGTPFGCVTHDQMRSSARTPNLIVGDEAWVGTAGGGRWPVLGDIRRSGAGSGRYRDDGRVPPEAALVSVGRRPVGECPRRQPGSCGSLFLLRSPHCAKIGSWTRRAVPASYPPTARRGRYW